MKISAIASGARDQAKPPDYFFAYISRMEKQLDLGVATGKPVYFVVAGDYCVRMTRAAYSAGSPVRECQGFLKRSADYQIRYFTEGVESRLAGLREIEEYLEDFSAAYLVGAAAKVIAVFDRVTPDRMHTWDRALLAALRSVLLGRPIPPDEEGFGAASKMKEFAALPDLFRAVERRDMPLFAESLMGYLSKSWGPPADRVAKQDLRLTYPNYAGKWSFFSAAMCRIMGGVPSLPKKVLQYIPVDLVGK